MASPSLDFSWPLDQTVRETVGGAVQINSVSNYYWMVVVGGILAFAMAWGIGANDVANAFATSVGAGSLSLKWACAIAAVMEFSGALLLGGNVSDTVRKKIIDPDVFDPNQPNGALNGPEILMTGFLVALMAATVWLIIATYLSLPVSTTHSIIGALVGVGIAYRGGGTVNWFEGDTFKKKLKGVVGVILSWIISPLLSAVFAVIFFLIVRTLVLRRKDPVRNGLIFMPLFYGFAVALAVFFIIYKGDSRFDIAEDLGVGPCIGIALGSGAVVAIISAFTIVPLAKRYLARWEARRQEAQDNPEAAAKKAEKSKKVHDALRKVGVNVSIKEELDEDVIRIHDSAEDFDPKAEQLFTWIQIFTAAFDSFAHGANDVANAIAPFASIFQLHRNHGIISGPETAEFESDGTFTDGEKDGESFREGDDLPNHAAFCGTVDGRDYFQCTDTPAFPFANSHSPRAQSVRLDQYDENGDLVSSDSLCYTNCNRGSYSSFDGLKQDVPLWILAMGGVGIVLGLAMWGYRIILAIGVKLTKLTPSRGFSIEIGAAITVLIASQIGIPVSTTHCQVGATMGVGLVEFKRSTVNWKQFVFICIGWVFTVLFTGLVSAVIFLVITRSPQNFSATASTLDYCPGQRLFLYDSTIQKFRGISCAGVDF
ncbi:Sodium-dependent phosphate transporter 1-A [Gracilariopsis chorda]|uniref:Phosphate transporter n=2 Tax=Gracilariopsis TaxID=2781 RepID=A0A2V3J4T7_9FLOR|nr:phosphate transporter [Gracilariopsis lemaneiformis]PXF49323.1 Sodium-dependent phosphate transporter 1-A [Gracilariopsis chorda]|eukprot:PXF49323.1 Sodium-dependent phosphate transporter 1-A [Gracilariopsis chorda]